MSEALLISSSGNAALTTAASTCDAIAYFNGSYDGTTLTLPIAVSKIVIGSFMNIPNKVFVPTPIACGIGTFNFTTVGMQVSSTTPSYVSVNIWIQLTTSTLKLGLYTSGQSVSAFIFCYK